MQRCLIEDHVDNLPFRIESVHPSGDPGKDAYARESIDWVVQKMPLSKAKHCSRVSKLFQSAAKVLKLCLVVLVYAAETAKRFAPAVVCWDAARTESESESSNVTVKQEDENHVKLLQHWKDESLFLFLRDPEPHAHAKRVRNIDERMPSGSLQTGMLQASWQAIPAPYVSLSDGLRRLWCVIATMNTAISREMCMSKVAFLDVLEFWKVLAADRSNVPTQMRRHLGIACSCRTARRVERMAVDWTLNRRKQNSLRKR